SPDLPPLSLHDALPILARTSHLVIPRAHRRLWRGRRGEGGRRGSAIPRKVDRYSGLHRRRTSDGSDARAGAHGRAVVGAAPLLRSEEHTSELQSLAYLV